MEFRRGFYAVTALSHGVEADLTGVALTLPLDHDASSELPSINHGTVGLGGVRFDRPIGPDTAAACRGQRVAIPPGRYGVAWLVGALVYGTEKDNVRIANGGGDRPATLIAQVEYADGSLADVPFQLADRDHPAGQLVAAWDGLRAAYLSALPLDATREAVGLVLPTAPHARIIAATAEPTRQGAHPRVVGAASTDLFVGTEGTPRQVVKIAVANVGTQPASSFLAVRGDLHTPSAVPVNDIAPGAIATAEVGVEPSGMVDEYGSHVAAEVVVDDIRQPITVTLAKPGWTMHMVSHFHYDPVWWNTQAAYTESWSSIHDPGWINMHPGFTLVKAHLDLARRDPDYKFVLAEIDYLKPYWNSFPEDRAYLRQLIREGRLEYVGGMYNEPSPVLTSAELTIRNVIYGIGYQREVLGGDPQSAWMLDVFGHDPQFPGICAAGGLTSSSWARGPHHEWGPKHHVGDNSRMQFASEFEWVAPSGESLLTSYMPNHYSAGWEIDSATSLEGALDAAYQQYQELKPVAATRNILLPMGTDYTPPNRWLTRIHREWASRYVWPKFVTATARDYFDAVRADAAQRDIFFSPQTRDMNPVFTGCYFSYIDTKQAQREVETKLTAAEKFGTIAALLGDGFIYPQAEIDKAWRQLCFGAHHDGITGTESDQVYIDLMDSWRDAFDLAAAALDRAQTYLAGQVGMSDLAGTPLLVFNACSWARTDVVWADVTFAAPGPRGLRLQTADGSSVDVHIEAVCRHNDGTLASASIAFIAEGVPATGYATYSLVDSSDGPASPTWRALATATEIENEHYSVTVDSARGGAMTSLFDKAADKQMLQPGGVGNELLEYDEYDEHPEASAQGPWVTAPRGGPIASSADSEAFVVAETSPIGRRVTVHGSLPRTDGFVQEITLWHGVDRVDCTTRIDAFSGADTLVRARFATDVNDGLPISETAAAVTGRTFGFPNGDFDDVKWTLDYAANNWFAVGSTLVVRLSSGATQAVNVAEVIVNDVQKCHQTARAAVVALVRRGVTATTSTADGSRYGALDVDSNLPDFRIAVGGPDENSFTRDVLDAIDPAYYVELNRQLEETGTARIWVSAERPLKETWLPNADLRRPHALPVLIVASSGRYGDVAALAALTADLNAAPIIDVTQPAALDGTTGRVEDYTFGVLNRGLPGFTVDTSRDVYLGLLRSSTGWPSGVWIDPPRRTLPNGANFQTNNWSHSFSYSIVGHGGDWRSAGLVRHGHEFNNPLTARVVSSDQSKKTEPIASVFAQRSPENEGVLPQRLALLEASGPDVVVTALKPRGNPMADQSGHAADVSTGVVARLTEIHGEPAQTRLSLLGGLREPMRTNLLEAGAEALEKTDDGSVSASLNGFEIATISGDRSVRAKAPGSSLTPRSPRYAQYWRHNTGAAPIGNQPLTVTLQPELISTFGAFPLTVRISTEHTAGTVTGTLGLVLPDGWAANKPRTAYELPPGGWAAESVEIVASDSAPDGRYFVATQVTDCHGVTYESVAAVDLVRAANSRDRCAESGAIGQVRAQRSLALDRHTLTARMTPSDIHPHDSPELTASWVTRSLELRPGGNAELVVRLTNRAHSEVRGEAILVTPYIMWRYTDLRAARFNVAASGEESVRFSFTVPPNAPPATGWALMKFGYFGRLIYTETIPVVISE